MKFMDNFSEPHKTREFTELQKLVGINIRRRREAKGLSRDLLADFVGVTEGYIGLIERGDRGTTLGHLLKICKLLECAVEDLADGYEGHGGRSGRSGRDSCDSCDSCDGYDGCDVPHDKDKDGLQLFITRLTTMSMTGVRDVDFLIAVAEAAYKYRKDIVG